MNLSNTSGGEAAARRHLAHDASIRETLASLGIPGLDFASVIEWSTVGANRMITVIEREGLYIRPVHAVIAGCVASGMVLAVEMERHGH